MPLGRSSQDRATKGQRTTGSNSRETSLNAAALQDHLTRRLRMPGGPTAQPSTQPGADLTLAQHRGLFPRPPPLLTEQEWNAVQLQSRTRQDSTHECPICREDFREDAQVLLSCSHVFHRACLTSFERFARTKCCPLCRAEQYQKRLIQDGKELYRNKCATRIQAAFRGWAARRVARALRRHRPPADARLRAKWAAERLQEDSDRLIAEMDDERGDIDALFAELDASMTESRRVCDAITQPLARQLREAGRQEVVSGIYSGGGASAPSRSASDAPAPHDDQPFTDEDIYGDASPVAASAPTTSGWSTGGVGPVDWEYVVSQAKARGDSECSICLGPLQRRGDAGVCWLSCTHTFHLDCITAFEAYELTGGGKPSCPVCRGRYQRRCLK